MTPPKEICRWIITKPGKLTPVVECGAPATHYCSESRAQFCRQHSEDYEDAFDNHSLKEFPIEESKP